MLLAWARAPTSHGYFDSFFLSSISSSLFCAYPSVVLTCGAVKEAMATRDVTYPRRVPCGGAGQSADTRARGGRTRLGSAAWGAP